MEKKSVNGSMTIAITVAFVWFTTHFGGGFASGAQVLQYYTKFGWFAVVTPVLAMGLQALVMYFAFKWAYDHEVFDYRSWANSFYKPYEKIFANIFELIYIIAMLTATAVAFATGGATIKSAFGLNFLAVTIVIAIVIFLLTIYGAGVVRKAASYLAIFLIVGILVVYLPNVIANWSKITANIAGLKSGEIPSDVTVWDAIVKAILYASFQSSVLGAYIAHSDVFKSRKMIKESIAWGFGINAGLLLLTVLGVMGFYTDGILKETVPTLFLVKNGVGASWMVTLISLLIVVGAVTTGVNLVFGNTQRMVILWGRNEDKETRQKNEPKRAKIVSLIIVIITWAIAQFGLIPLVAKGYGMLGYLGIIFIVIPILFRGIKGWEGKSE